MKSRADLLLIGVALLLGPPPTPVTGGNSGRAEFASRGAKAERKPRDRRCLC